MWKNLFFFAAVPVIIASTINAFYLADPSEMDPPPFVPYDHLRIRTKVQLTLHRRHLGDSQTFVKALLDWSSKIFLGGSNVIFVPSLYYFWPKKRFFCLLVGFFYIKKT